VGSAPPRRVDLANLGPFLAIPASTRNPALDQIFSFKRLDLCWRSPESVGQNKDVEKQVIFLAETRASCGPKGGHRKYGLIAL
jgi:hypothetical protein